MIEEYVAPGIKVIKNAFPQAELFLETVSKAPEESWIKSSIDGYAYVPDFRSASELPIPYGLMFPKVFFDLAYTIHHQATRYSRENGFSFPHMEYITFLKYKKGSDFFNSHRDDGPNQPRSMSAVLYMNDVAEGGETVFDKFGVSIAPEAGKLILFPANFIYTHEAATPISNDKYAAITFFGMELSGDVFDKYYSKYGVQKQGDMLT